uniref:Uncharacterized protein n=1 Tax=Aegilops tauschii subsp. strangulata TaxID=200361 RepID=A0A453BVU0_AEGTS
GEGKRFHRIEEGKRKGKTSGGHPSRRRPRARAVLVLCATVRRGDLARDPAEGKRGRAAKDAGAASSAAADYVLLCRIQPGFLSVYYFSGLPERWHLLVK